MLYESVDSDMRSLTTPAARFMAELTDWLEIQDQEAIKIIMATAAAIYLPGDPVWTMVVGASGAGKTELLSCFDGSEDVRLLGGLTPHTLASGLKGAKHLINELDGRLIVIKDMAPIFSMPYGDMAEILGQLRDIYDGRFVKVWGSGQSPLNWTGSIGALVGVTMAVERKWVFFAELGERFFRVDLFVDAHKLVRAAIERNGQEIEMRAALSDAAERFMSDGRSFAETWDHRPAPEYLSRVQDLAILAAILRTPAARDRNHALQYLPQPEVGSRLGKSMLRLSDAWAMINCRISGDEEFDLLLRLASDTIPSRRRTVVAALCQEVSNAALERSRIPNSTIREELEDLTVLGVVISKTELRFTSDIQGLFERSGLLERFITHPIP